MKKEYRLGIVLIITVIVLTVIGGTYYIKGGDNGASFLDNAKII